VISLIVWMNGERVGEWGALRTGTPFFRYEESWVNSPRGRALSLSLPITADRELRGPAVHYYFDNLLPDNPDIRRRIRTRFGTPSSDAFDLLTAIGRDCVGAVQLLPPDEDPVGWDRIDATSLTEEQVEQTLRDVTVSAPLGHEEQEHFRISLSGAQEKTALLYMASKWFRPRQATPTTHILKLPLGIIGNFRGDFSDSVENEWLCGQLLRELGLAVADVTLARFGEQRALVVTRFDRRWMGAESLDVQKQSFKPGKSIWIARLPQEDFCQAMGFPPTRRYQADGGPSIQDCLRLLSNSEQPVVDQTSFMLAQLAFWLLAATDGHAKNFSLYQRPGGAYGLTPLYDVLSAWPVIGHGKNQLAFEKAKLAMALPGNRAHYRLKEITARHWQELAAQTGGRDLWARMQSLVESTPAALERAQKQLPRGFPERVYTKIHDGVRHQIRRFAQTNPTRGSVLA
jgi:serine/threonine-protein kinase HipA